MEVGMDKESVMKKTDMFKIEGKRGQFANILSEHAQLCKFNV